MKDSALLHVAEVAATEVWPPAYPARPPYDPGERYPELPHASLGRANPVYAGVRRLFALLGLHAARQGTAGWNPLGELIRPGDRVVIKPNLIAQSHRHRRDEWVQVITHPAVVRVVLDYVLLALQGRGEVIITDGPQYDSDWEEILGRSGLEETVRTAAAATQVPVRLLDLREYLQESRDDVVVGRRPLPGDPLGSRDFNLGRHSCFSDHAGAGRYYGSDYDQAETNGHHSHGLHEYRLAATPCAADVFINLPKMKTHKKVGATLCLKNLVGITTGRNWLPHYTDGSPNEDGDQFPSPGARGALERAGVRALQGLAFRHPRAAGPLFRVAKAVARPLFGATAAVVRSGNWYGNDTAWRMVLDLNRAFLYSDAEAFPTLTPRPYLAIVDGVVGGEGNGPLEPDAVGAGILLAGLNPLAVDAAAVWLMGFDPRRLPMIEGAWSLGSLALARFGLDDVRVRSDLAAWDSRLLRIPGEACRRFRPHFGWVSRIERGS